MKLMTVSKSANKMKDFINNAIKNHTITRDEYDYIISIATEDNVIDNQEKAILSQLHDMIENKTIKFVTKK
jgi:hypothetical protein